MNGSSESLGDAEAPRIDTLAGRKISWTRLTHEAAAKKNERGSQMPSLATYRVQIAPPEANVLRLARYFYWKSGSQFQAALKVCPGIANGYHGSGPGHTHDVVKASIPNDRVGIFLSEVDFQERVKP